MSTTNTLPTTPCPSCRSDMQTEELERNDHGTVRVELCFICAGFWFDHLASVELAPGAVIKLFQEIHSHRETQRQPVASRLSCPRCGDTLSLSYDLSKSGRFTYFRCLRGDGRFTPFFQFLREKQFVRSLTPAEIQQVKAQVQQVNCSQCGAPIDLQTATECQYCHAPVSLLDPAAVDKAVRTWTDAEARRHLSPAAATAATAMPRVPQQQTLRSVLSADYVGSISGLSGLNSQASGGLSLGLDLVDLGIRGLAHLFENH
jgi:hypothetical protein